MGVFTKWLLHENQKDLFEVLFAIGLTLVFLLVTTVIFLSLGKPSFVLQIGRGYLLLWGLLLFVVGVTNRVHDYFKINIYDHANVFLVSNLLASCGLQIAWAIFVALSVHRFCSTASLLVTIVINGMALLSSLVRFYVVSAFYQGHLYRFVSLPLALLTFGATSGWVRI